MCEDNESIVSVFAPGRKHISTEIVRDSVRTVFTITFENEETKGLQIPDFVNKKCTYN